MFLVDLSHPVCAMANAIALGAAQLCTSYSLTMHVKCKTVLWTSSGQLATTRHKQNGQHLPCQLQKDLWLLAYLLDLQCQDECLQELQTLGLHLFPSHCRG